eukprot:CAMPEP_0181190674 /NCGR_PEP_ID=MMETSP1096-20121128/12320_1 /TAXON_ID=156174 ORGANISM="Chrysochromulina ericina, Strain CCMP281" /NCGR_SAMPLE_ID=MMETSP1096 /ASSEMBLY_ACC=CAM_ASM_000453 /LENGTH=145 /DNA_ID=CAMNT_0023279907 /DNA_START=134 /DNA_END=567 /DNA_ORIENTATION=-
MMLQLRVTRFLREVAAAQLNVQSAMIVLVWLGEVEPGDRIDDSLRAGADGVHDAHVTNMLVVSIVNELGRRPMATRLEAAVPRDRREARGAVNPGMPEELQRRPAKRVALQLRRIHRWRLITRVDEKAVEDRQVGAIEANQLGYV